MYNCFYRFFGLGIEAKVMKGLNGQKVCHFFGYDSSSVPSVTELKTAFDMAFQILLKVYSVNGGG
jgi:hypothetical protein